MAKNGQYCVHVHTFTSDRSFLMAMTSLVTYHRYVPNVLALTAISYKSQKVFEFYRDSQTDTQKDMYMYICNEIKYITMDFLQIR